MLFFAENRKADDRFFVDWNEYIASKLCYWAWTEDCGDYDNIKFQCQFPKKGSLLEQFLDFEAHHPILEEATAVPDKNTPTIIKNWQLASW